MTVRAIERSRVSIHVDVRGDSVSFSIGGAGQAILLDVPPESDPPMAHDDDFESRIDRIKREAKEQRDDAGQANKEFSQGCRKLLREIVRPLFDRTKIKLDRDDEVAVNWAAVEEDEIHFSAQNRRTRRTYTLHYRCHWPDRRVQRRTTIKPPTGARFEWDHTDGYEVLDLSQQVLEGHLEELLKLAFSGLGAPHHAMP